MEGYTAEIGSVLQQKLRPLDQALREEMEETRVAVNDQSSNIEKVSQAVSNTAYMSEQLLSEIKNQFQAQRVINQEKFDETRNLFLQYCAHGNNGNNVNPAPRQPSYFPREPSYSPAEPTYAPREEPYLPTKPKDPVYTVPASTTPRTPYSPSVTQATGSSEKRDCSDLLKERITQRTLYNFASDKQDSTAEGHDFFSRYCDMETSGGGWTVIQRRGMFGPPFENFTMSWKDYKNGFGDLNREFWWGNDNIYRLIRNEDTTIRFDLWDFEGNYAYAEYLSFSIADESNNYKLSVFGYQGNASDSFSAHNGYLFSTYDRDNDEAPECCPCAPAYGGGWWFYSCFESNLNGEYHLDPKDNDYYRGIIWELWLGDYSLKATEIKIRPTSFSTDGNHGDTLPIPQPTLPNPTPYPDPTNTLSPELPLRRHE